MLSYLMLHFTPGCLCPPLASTFIGCWRQQKAIADRELRVFVRHVDFDNMELQDGVRLFVAEAYEPAMAPPASVDPLLQGAALNAKPPKPPRYCGRTTSYFHGLLQHRMATLI
jgi:hypothetical protein